MCLLSWRASRVALIFRMRLNFRVRQGNLCASSGVGLVVWRQLWSSARVFEKSNNTHFSKIADAFIGKYVTCMGCVSKLSSPSGAPGHLLARLCFVCAARGRWYDKSFSGLSAPECVMVYSLVRARGVASLFPTRAFCFALVHTRRHVNLFFA